MFRHPVAIEPGDIDHMGHVNNAVYLKWVQEAVVDYWSSVAPPSAVAQHLWVALKHEITYLRPTFLTDNPSACRPVTPFVPADPRRVPDMHCVQPAAEGLRSAEQLEKVLAVVGSL